MQDPFEPDATRSPDDPEPTDEPDLPSDGADEIGEAMIRDLPRTSSAGDHITAPEQHNPKQILMATNPNVPPPEPVSPLSTPPEPGEIQPTPLPT